jgi:hypothetical protein
MTTEGHTITVTGKLYLDTFSRRTIVTLGKFDTMAEALAFIANDYRDWQVAGEEITLTTTD